MKQRYQQALKLSAYTADAAQAKAVDCLAACVKRITRRAQRWQLAPRFIRRWWSHKPVRGVYLWGGVGVGKTFLMDLFYDSLPLTRKKRIHFHRFMQRVHQQLQAYEGQRNPLWKIANEWAEQTQVLCLDEFMVMEITDAMILAELLGALFATGVTLVTTSNVSPDALYQHGLQRSRFLPAIQLIKRHCQTFELHTQCDYRLRLLSQAALYQSPLDEGSDYYLREYFDGLVNSEVQYHETVVINRRQLITERIGANVIWFDFKNLCTVPRSQQDYLEIARCYHTVLLGNVPQLVKDDWARNFIHMVDVFYDHRVKLIITAATTLQNLYPNGRLNFEFQRTQSRLIEMQSQAYLSQAHLV